MDRYRALLERYVELYNAGDLDGVMDLYAEDAVQLMPDGTFEGRAAIKDRLARELAAFGDIAHRYVSYVEQGDAFADEWVFAGTHTGPLQLPDGTELAATGKRVEIPGMELVKVRGGKIVVDNLYYDNLAVGPVRSSATTRHGVIDDSCPLMSEPTADFSHKVARGDLPRSPTEDCVTVAWAHLEQHPAQCLHSWRKSWTIWKSSLA